MYPPLVWVPLYPLVCSRCLALAELKADRDGEPGAGREEVLIPEARRVSAERDSALSMSAINLETLLKISDLISINH